MQLYDLRLHCCVVVNVDCFSPEHLFGQDVVDGKFKC